MEHTPGPWHVTSAGYIGSANDGFVPIVSPFRENTFKDQFGNPTDETQANARLIASAPELLVALEAVVSDLNYGGRCTTTRFQLAHAAIKQAKGE